MSDNDRTSRTEQAEERTRCTHACMRSVRRATRRRYTPGEKIRIVLDGFRRELTVNDLYGREGINPANYYSWTKEFMEAGKERRFPAPLPGRQCRDPARISIEPGRFYGSLRICNPPPASARASGTNWSISISSMSPELGWTTRALTTSSSWRAGSVPE